MKLSGVEIFRVGTWSGSRKVTVTSGMLDEIVSNFETLNSKVTGFGVPVKIGHNEKIGEPAYGWASNVYRQGDVALADFEDIPPELVDRIQKRQYNAVSIELRPAVSYGDKTFKNVLSAVALLGAEHPAVKGLKPLSDSKASLFADDGEALTFNQEMRVKIFTQEEADALVAAAVAKTTADFQSKIDASEVALTAANTEKDVAVAALATFKAEGETVAFASLIDAAVKAGKILPKSKDLYAAMAATFAGKAEKIKFGEKEVTPVEMFKSFLDTLPVLVKFGEQGLGGEADIEGEKASDQINAKAKALMGTDAKLDYSAAVAKVLASDESLKAAYLQEIA